MNEFEGTSGHSRKKRRAEVEVEEGEIGEDEEGDEEAGEEVMDDEPQDAEGLEEVEEGSMTWGEFRSTSSCAAVGALEQVHAPEQAQTKGEKAEKGILELPQEVDLVNSFQGEEIVQVKEPGQERFAQNVAESEGDIVGEHEEDKTNVEEVKAFDIWPEQAGNHLEDGELPGNAEVGPRCGPAAQGMAPSSFHARAEIMSDLKGNSEQWLWRQAAQALPQGMSGSRPSSPTSGRAVSSVPRASLTDRAGQGSPERLEVRTPAFLTQTETRGETFMQRISPRKQGRKAFNVAVAQGTSAGRCSIPAGSVLRVHAAAVHSSSVTRNLSAGKGMTLGTTPVKDEPALEEATAAKCRPTASSPRRPLGPQGPHAFEPKAQMGPRAHPQVKDEPAPCGRPVSAMGFIRSPGIHLESKDDFLEGTTGDHQRESTSSAGGIVSGSCNVQEVSGELQAVREVAAAATAQAKHAKREARMAGDKAREQGNATAAAGMQVEEERKRAHAARLQVEQERQRVHAQGGQAAQQVLGQVALAKKLAATAKAFIEAVDSNMVQEVLCRAAEVASASQRAVAAGTVAAKAKELNEALQDEAVRKLVKLAEAFACTVDVVEAREDARLAKEYAERQRRVAELAKQEAGAASAEANRATEAVKIAREVLKSENEAADMARTRAALAREAATAAQLQAEKFREEADREHEAANDASVEAAGARQEAARALEHARLATEQMKILQAAAQLAQSEAASLKLEAKKARDARGAAQEEAIVEMKKMTMEIADTKQEQDRSLRELQQLQVQIKAARTALGAINIGQSLVETPKGGTVLALPDASDEPFEEVAEDEEELDAGEGTPGTLHGPGDKTPLPISDVWKGKPKVVGVYEHRMPAHQVFVTIRPKTLLVKELGLAARVHFGYWPVSDIKSAAVAAEAAEYVFREKRTGFHYLKREHKEILDSENAHTWYRHNVEGKPKFWPPWFVCPSGEVIKFLRPTTSRTRNNLLPV